MVERDVMMLYVYSKDKEPQLMVTGKWSTSMSYQPHCDVEGEPLPGTELKEVLSSLSLKFAFLTFIFVAFLFGLLRTGSFHGFAFFTILFIMKVMVSFFGTITRLGTH
jgi:hypothetical protein